MLLPLLAGVLGACSSQPDKTETPETSASAAEAVVEPPPGPPEPEVVETGHACATAKTVCDGGSCALKLDNQCEAPLTCDGFVLVRCRTNTETVEARGRGRQTFPAKAENEMTISAGCTMGNALVSTNLSELQCK